MQAGFSPRGQNRSVSNLPGSYETMFQEAEQRLDNLDEDGALEILQRIYTRLGKLDEKQFVRRPPLRQLYQISIRMSANILAWQQRYDEAISHFHWLADVDPDMINEARVAVARLKIDQGQADAGLDEIRSLIVANPGADWLWLSLGVEQSGLEQLEDAEAAFRRVLTSDTASDDQRFDALANIYDLYRSQDRLEEAEQAWLEAWTYQKEAMDVLPLYQMYWEAGQLDKAEEWLRQEQNPYHQGLYRGLLQKAHGDANRALSTWQKTAAHSPFEATGGQDSWAEAALRSGTDPNQVITTLAQAVRQQDLSLRGAVMLGLADAMAGYTEAAHNALKMTVQNGRRQRPPQDKLAAAYWPLFDELLGDEVLKADLQPYFDLPADAEVTEITPDMPAATADESASPPTESS